MEFPYQFDRTWLLFVHVLLTQYNKRNGRSPTLKLWHQVQHTNSSRRQQQNRYKIMRNKRKAVTAFRDDSCLSLDKFRTSPHEFRNSIDEKKNYMVEWAWVQQRHNEQEHTHYTHRIKKRKRKKNHRKKIRGFNVYHIACVIYYI